MIFIIALVFAITAISGHKKSAENKIAEKYSKQIKESPEGRPRILIMLDDDSRLAGRSPSLWWSYQNTGSGKDGC